VAFVNGDHNEETCRTLWKRVPETCRKCHSFSDFWKAYAAVLPEEAHRSVGKGPGRPQHMERWNNTLRQRFVRETLSFSKKDWWHNQVTRCFIVEYNLSCNWQPLPTGLTTGPS